MLLSKLVDELCQNPKAITLQHFLCSSTYFTSREGCDNYLILLIMCVQGKERAKLFFAAAWLSKTREFVTPE